MTPSLRSVSFLYEATSPYWLRHSAGTARSARPCCMTVYLAWISDLITISPCDMMAAL